MSELWTPAKDDAEERRIRIPLTVLMELYRLNSFTQRIWRDHKGIRHQECWDPHCPQWSGTVDGQPPFWADEAKLHWHRID